MKYLQQQAIRNYASLVTHKAWGPKTETGKKIKSKLNMPQWGHRNYWCGITQSLSWESWEALILNTQ